jgi:large subunit ribosomal protein L24
VSSMSTQPRRQRRALFDADTFERRRRMSVPLSRELRTRYGRRSLPVRKGDTVRILSGSYKGREERVAKIDRRSYAMTLDNVTGKTADAKMKPLPIRPSHLVLTRLNLADPWRRRVLKVPESESPAEEETPEAGATPAPTTETAPAVEKKAPRKRKAKEPSADKEEPKT